MSTAKRWIARIVLALIGTVIGLLCIEALVRMRPANSAAEMLFNAPQNTPRGMYMNDHKVVFRPTPGFEGTMTSVGYSVDIRVNSLGLRGPEIQQDARPVWLALGDSFTFAAQVSEEESFVGRLGEDLGVQLLNAGSDGHGTQHELARFRQLETQITPEVVVLVFFTGNDFANNIHWRNALSGARHKPDQFAIMGGPKPPVRAFLNKHSLLWGMLQMRQRSRAMADGSNPEVRRWRKEMSIFHLSGKKDLREGIEATRPPMQLLKQRVEDRDARLMVAVASPAFAIEEHRAKATFELVDLLYSARDLGAPEQAVVELLEELDIAACPMDDALRESYAEGQSAYLKFDGHWNASGHAVVAETIGACLRDQGFAP